MVFLRDFKVRILFVMLLSILFLFIQSDIASAKQTFKSANGGNVKASPKVIGESGIVSKEDGFNRFYMKDRKDTGNINKVYGNIFKLEAIVEEYKDCKNDTCKKHLKKIFGEQQEVLMAMGIGIKYPEGGVSKYKGKEHFWVYSDEASSAKWISDNGDIYKKAKKDMDDRLWSAWEKEGKCKGYNDCKNKEKAKIKKEIDEKVKLEENKETKNELNKKNEGIENKIEILEDSEKKLKDNDASNDEGALKKLCDNKLVSDKVCKDSDKKEAKRQALIEIEKKKKELEEKRKKNESDIEKINGDIKKAENNIAKTEEENSKGNYTGPVGESANLPVLPEDSKGRKQVMVAYEGLFTQKKLAPASCSDEDLTEEGKESKDFKTGNVAGKETEGKIAKILADIMTGAIKSVVNVLFGLKCPGSGSGDFSLISEILNVTSPLNLTHNYIVMKLVSITQSIAYIFAFGLIVAYGVMYTTGFENMDPFKFGIRMFIAMMLVYFLPYLMQDVLNLNNVIVYYFSQITVQFDGSSASTSVVFAGAIRNFMETLATSFLKNILTLILAIVMIYFALSPIIRIFTWWYTRMLKIFFYAIIGPVLVVFMALPQTSGMAAKWTKNFIGETFSQVFMVLAMSMLAFIVGNMGDFQILTNVGWLGSLLVMYASILFLAEVPSISKEFIGGGRGLDPARLAGSAMGAAAGALAGTKNMGKNFAAAAKANSQASQNGERFAATKSVVGAKGISGKIGALAGSMGGKGYNAKIPGTGHSAKDAVDAKVKPKIDNFNAKRNNRKTQNAMNRQERNNLLMNKQAQKERDNNGASLNERTADLMDDTAERANVMELLGKVGTVQDIRNKNSISSAGGSNGNSGKNNNSNQQAGGSSSSSSTSSNQQAGSGSATGSNQQASSSSSSSSGSATGSNQQVGGSGSSMPNSDEFFGSNMYEESPMSDQSFEQFNASETLNEYANGESWNDIVDNRKERAEHHKEHKNVNASARDFSNVMGAISNSKGSENEQVKRVGDYLSSQGITNGNDKEVSKAIHKDSGGASKLGKSLGSNVQGRERLIQSMKDPNSDEAKARLADYDKNAMGRIEGKLNEIGVSGDKGREVAAKLYGSEVSEKTGRQLGQIVQGSKGNAGSSQENGKGQSGKAKGNVENSPSTLPNGGNGELNKVFDSGSSNLNMGSYNELISDGKFEEVKKLNEEMKSSGEKVEVSTDGILMGSDSIEMQGYIESGDFDGLETMIDKMESDVITNSEVSNEQLEFGFEEVSVVDGNSGNEVVSEGEQVEFDLGDVVENQNVESKSFEEVIISEDNSNELSNQMEMNLFEESEQVEMELEQQSSSHSFDDRQENKMKKDLKRMSGKYGKNEDVDVERVMKDFGFNEKTAMKYIEMLKNDKK